MSGIIHLTEDTGQIIRSLSRDVIEIYTMPNDMYKHKENSLHSDDYVESDVRIECDVVIEDGLPEVGNEVASHCEEEHWEGEHQYRGCSPSYSHYVAGDSS